MKILNTKYNRSLFRHSLDIEFVDNISEVTEKTSKAEAIENGKPLNWKHFEELQDKLNADSRTVTLDNIKDFQYPEIRIDLIEWLVDAIDKSDNQNGQSIRKQVSNKINELKI